MKKILCSNKPLITMLIFIALSITCSKKNPDSPCLHSTVTLDVSSLESILLKSDEILENPDAFWENDGAYTLAKKWHDINQIPLDTLNYYNTWIERLEGISHLSEAQKQNHPSFQLMNAILERKKVFDERALPHICSFLPKNNVNLNTTIYLAGHTLAWAFMTHSNIVINVLHSHYKGKSSDDFMNTIVHEVFHIGYGKNRSYRTEIELENFSIYDMLDSFHNEGMAVYTAYKAQEFFPAPDEKDYVLLEDANEVKRLLKELNDFFPKTESLSENVLRQRAWDLGVTQRAYYVVGAFMAKTIDEKAGRESLIETIKKGPMSFVSTYNQLVKQELRVYEFKLPEALSDYQLLKQAVLSNDLKSFKELEIEIEKSDVSMDLEGKLNSLGYNMLHRQENEWAIRIFTLSVDLFPESANAYDSLGEAYMKAGEKKNALKNYKKALELNPNNDNAKQMLKKLKG